MEYLIKQYPLETGALEIQYIEEYFGEFPRKKTATEILARLRDREFLILMAEAPLPDDPGMVAPVAFKIVHEIRAARKRAQARRSRGPSRQTACSSRIGRCSTAGLAAPVATGADRVTSAR